MSPWVLVGSLPGGAETPISSGDEVRALWVVRTTMTSPARVRSMVSAAANAGFNTLLVQVRGRADAFYASGWEPRAEQLGEAPQDFDPLELVISEAHARGLTVHAWVNTLLVWGQGELPLSPAHLVHAHPDWLAVPRSLSRELHGMDAYRRGYVEALRSHVLENATLLEGLYGSPSHPGMRARVQEVWIELATRYELDGMHFDYVRLPSLEFDYSRTALEAFRDWVSSRVTAAAVDSLEAASPHDPLALAEALSSQYADFQRAQVTALVERVSASVRARRPELVVSAAVVADPTEAYETRFQDWRRWLAEGYLDVVVPMAYTTDGLAFEALVREATVSAGRRERAWAGIGAWQDTVEGTLEKIAIARREGAGGVVLFSYDWAVGEAPSVGGVPYLEHVGRMAFGGS